MMASGDHRQQQDESSRDTGGQFATLRQKLREIFDDAQRDYDEYVRKHGPRVWNETLSKNETKRFAAALVSPPKPLCLESAAKPIDGAKKCTITASTGFKKDQKVGIYRMESVKPLPPMSAWVYTPRNYSVDEEQTLTHIPFTDGEDRDKFENDLVNYYGGHVHGHKPSGFANDRMIFEIIQKLTEFYLKEFGFKGEKLCQKSDVIEPPEIAYQVFAAEFPDKGTARELRKKFSDLMEKFGPGSKSKDTTSEVMPNIDGPSPISTSRERVMHTYASLFCRRCYVYDCNLHDLPANPYRRRKKPGPPGNESEKIPCGPNCYMREDLYCTLSLPNKLTPVKRSNLKVETAESEPARGGSILGKKSRSSLPGWSPKDETLFRVYRGAFGDNFCDIAECLGNKNCRQVRDFAMMEGPEVDESTLSPPLPTGSKKSSKISQDHHHRFRVMKWAGSDAGTVQNTYPYNPCDHPPGFMCSEENCECAAKNNFCMKFCNCSSSCLNRFPGCRCRAHCNTRQCSCFMAMRECDPDLCTSCGASDFDSEEIKCTNVAIQRHWKKHLLLAPSDVAGWGIFLKDAVKKGEFISEYCGELMSHDEAERRGKIYDRLKCSYLFGLNGEQEVDATRKGNKIRFANHSTNPNCATKLMMVNGDHRIGIYAQEDIDEGEELFFDYRYSTQDKLKFVSIERPKNS